MKPAGVEAGKVTDVIVSVQPPEGTASGTYTGTLCDSNGTCLLEEVGVYVVGDKAALRRRIVILGGGMAGLAAAWRLSDPDGEPAEVTVYQRGWRLGGKGASSRGPNGRIEEHGLHVWLGFYDNAFRLLRSCYEELDRPGTDPACPIQDWRDAFVPASTIGLGRPGGDRFLDLASPVPRERPAARRSGWWRWSSAPLTSWNAG